MKNSRIIFGLLVIGVIFSQLHCGIGRSYDKENDMNAINVNIPQELVITEENGNVVARVGLKGFEQKDINVRIKGNELWITAKHQEKKETHNKNIYSKKAREYSFEDMQTLPCKVRASAMQWELSEDGMLTVTIPKA